MSRSVWKGPFISSELFEEFLKKPNKKVFKTQSRNSVILPCFIGKTIKVYNGKKYISFNVTEDMVGYKLGEFVLTRLRHIYKKK